MSTIDHPKLIASEWVDEPPTMMVYPTEQMAEAFSKERLAR
ncbi:MULTISPECIES: phage terminase large subunit family protein [unclassified Brevibacillus]|nr:MULTISPECIES: phage terminase large subunit family protein [unclassified Brevibacillus]MDH6352164.1 hypothetical protein [Brevibacillus sp. 1238]UED67410.1 phage terminase large subunit family protein [Brevibacillus sp. HD3.3A]